MAKYSAKDLLAIPQKDRPFQIKMVERIPIKSEIKRYTYMSNSESPSYEAAHIIQKTGYYMVEPQESVIFYTKGSGELDPVLFLPLTYKKS
jgi:hypothetical protein